MATAGAPIGVFDSGLGGLTVAKAIRAPPQGIHRFYSATRARLPMAPGAAATVHRFTRQCLQFLMGLHPKMLVVACNTASALALDKLQGDFDVPVIGVLEGKAPWPAPPS